MYCVLVVCIVFWFSVLCFGSVYCVLIVCIVFLWCVLCFGSVYCVLHLWATVLSFMDHGDTKTTPDVFLSTLPDVAGKLTCCSKLNFNEMLIRVAAES